jgi:hypothetical protein
LENTFRQLLVAYSILPESFYKDFRLVVELISILISEGAQAAPNHSHQLIVASIDSKMNLHFHNNCRIFFEGDWWSTTSRTCNGFIYLIDKMLKLIKLNSAFGHNLASGLASSPASGHNLASGRAFGNKLSSSSLALLAMSALLA